MLTAPGPATLTGAWSVTLCAASRVRRLALVQLNDDATVMVTAPLPVVTFTSDAASMFARSVALRTAFFAVCAQTPAEQVMPLVGALEISTEACAAFAAPITTAAPANAFVQRIDTPCYRPCAG